MCLNDIFDADHDRVQRPSRPIPSGRVSLKGAWFLTFGLFASGLMLLLKAPFRQGLYCSFLLIAAIVWYDRCHKEYPFSVLLMAFCRLLVFAVTSLALIGETPLLVLAAGGIQFAYVVCISLVARYENNSPTPFTFPVVPLMLAGISLLDGIVLAVLVSPIWLVAGIGGGGLMLTGQRVVKGD